MNPEVIVLGGCVTDFTVYTPRLPVPGETVVAKLFQYGYGGTYLNSLNYATFRLEFLQLKPSLVSCFLHIVLN